MLTKFIDSSGDTVHIDLATVCVAIEKENITMVILNCNTHIVLPTQEGNRLIALINNAGAPVAVPAPKTTDVTIISMTRDQTKNGSPMWRCGTDKGFMVNVFKHDDPLKDSFNMFETAGYAPEMLAMQYGDTINWTKHPIAVSLVANGSFWNVVSITQRPEGAAPDEPTIDDD